MCEKESKGVARLFCTRCGEDITEEYHRLSFGRFDETCLECVSEVEGC